MPHAGGVASGLACYPLCGPAHPRARGQEDGLAAPGCDTCHWVKGLGLTSSVRSLIHYCFSFPSTSNYPKQKQLRNPKNVHKTTRKAQAHYCHHGACSPGTERCSFLAPPCANESHGLTPCLPTIKRAGRHPSSTALKQAEGGSIWKRAPRQLFLPLPSLSSSHSAWVGRGPCSEPHRLLKGQEPPLPLRALLPLRNYTEKGLSTGSARIPSPLCLGQQSSSKEARCPDRVAPS